MKLERSSPHLFGNKLKQNKKKSEFFSSSPGVVERHFRFLVVIRCFIEAFLPHREQMETPGRRRDLMLREREREREKGAREEEESEFETRWGKTFPLPSLCVFFLVVEKENTPRRQTYLDSALFRVQVEVLQKDFEALQG